MLFVAPFVLIGENNDGTGTARDIHQARHAIRGGRARTAAATLRPGILAADLDPAPGEEVLADACTEQLIRWCRHHHLPYLIRVSGRPGGRHVLAITTDTRHEKTWNTLCTTIARQFRIPIDNRTSKALRLLHAPHRSGAPAPVIAATMTPAHALDLATTAAPARRRHHRAPHTGASSRARDLSRSGREYGLACAMARRGYTTHQAWNHTAFTGGKSAQRGQCWWLRYLWMPAVTTVAAEHGATEDQAWRRARHAAPTTCRALTRARWQGLWQRAIHEATLDRPRRYHIQPPAPTDDLDLTALRAALATAADNAAAIRRRRPQLRRSLAVTLHALAPALTHHKRLSTRTLALRTRLDPKTVRAALALAVHAQLIEILDADDRHPAQARAYTVGNATTALLGPAPARSSPRSCSTPAPGHCHPSRLRRRIDTDRARWQRRPAPPLPVHPDSVEAKALRSYRFQRDWWHTQTSTERARRRSARRNLLRGLDPGTTTAWTTWLRTRAHLADAAENALAGTATPRNWTDLATTPATLHRGMRDPTWHTRTPPPTRVGRTPPEFTRYHTGNRQAGQQPGAPRDRPPDLENHTSEEHTTEAHVAIGRAADGEHRTPPARHTVGIPGPAVHSHTRAHDTGPQRRIATHPGTGTGRVDTPRRSPPQHASQPHGSRNQ